MKRVSTQQAYQFVAKREPFQNHSGSLYGKWQEYMPIYRDRHVEFRPPLYQEKLYVVYSYGSHWPLFIYSEATNQWYGNSDKHSRTTSKHKGSARPPVPGSAIQWRDVHTMREIATNGLGGSVCKQFREAA